MRNEMSHGRKGMHKNFPGCNLSNTKDTIVLKGNGGIACGLELWNSAILD